MKIANYKHEQGETVPTGKWLFSIEIVRCPPYMHKVFKPHIFIVFAKIIDPGEPYKLDGRPMKKKGGWWSWTLPFGIVFEII